MHVVARFLLVVSLVVGVSATSLLSQVCEATDSGSVTGISFDAPAIVRARVLSRSHVVTVKKPAVNIVQVKTGAVSDASEGAALPGNSLASEYGLNSSQNEMLIEIVVPVSTVLEPKMRDRVEEFRFDVFWNRTAYPLVDYGPRTITTSPIDGTVSIEQSSSRDASAGLNLSGKFEPIDGASATANLSGRESSSKRYQEIPQHEVLVASGSVRRGTGAFFRFHPSRHETLEGGRELVVAFRVPSQWRAGVLQVECRAVGSRKIVGSWREPFEYSRAFIVPVSLEGDDRARHLAEEYVREEQGLRASWNRFVQQSQSAPHPLAKFQRAIAGQPSGTLPKGLSKDWVHSLIQSGEDRTFDRVKGRLPRTVREHAGHFVEVRRKLLKLSR